ncbi:MAG TPA: hypothetical protein VNJ03_14705 [Vicinamibacterales bacterium]|nr:hypothetical protein [Vicinamibacterales bacterium]
MHTILAPVATPTNLSHNGARRMRRWLLLLVLPVVAACQGTSPTVPTPVVLTTPAAPAPPPAPAPGPAQNPPASVEGTWVGTMTDKSRTYPATLTVVQTDATLSGRWSGTGIDGADTSEMTGTYAADGSITMTWHASEYYNCPHGVTGTVSGGVMTAQYGTIQCSSNFAVGSLTLTRQ